MKDSKKNHLQLKSLNHVSMVCRSLEKTLDFYKSVLGFQLVKRPSCFDFDGAWLFNYGIGVHLIQSDDLDSLPKIRPINPKDTHISFQCESIEGAEENLKEIEIEYKKCRVEVEDIYYVDQLFFHDPDGHMIEICNCQKFPMLPFAL